MRKNLQKFSVVVALLLAMVGTAFASPLSGELNGGLAYTWNKEDKKLEQSEATTGFRIVLEDNLDSNGLVHFSAKGSVDWIGKDKLSLAADQLWYSGYAGDVDFKLGRQVISWGTADGFNPTNYFARLDTNALASADLSGEPIWAGQATYYAPKWSLTGVAVPFFKPQSLDGMEGFMGQGADLLDEDTVTQLLQILPPEKVVAIPGQVVQGITTTKKPRGLGKNTELALRAETQIQGFDVQASVFSGFEPLPGLMLEIDVGNAEVEVITEYRRQRFIGLATAGTIGPMGVWGEVTYGGPTPFKESPLVTVLSVNENYLQAVVGGDYTFDLGKGLLAQGQYIYRGQGSLFAPYGPADEIKAAHYLYGRLGYDFSMDSSVDLVVIHGVKEKGGLVRPSYTHRFPNAIQLELSAIGSYGEEESEFKLLPSQVRAGVTYKF